jgi:hypothetical protein
MSNVKVVAEVALPLDNCAKLAFGHQQTILD